MADGKGSLFFTDMDVNRIYKMDSEGKVSVIVEPSNNANGLAMDLDGSLLICEQSGQRISRMDASGKITVVVDSYKGKSLNSPNDIWVHPNDSKYFTDPRYRYPKGPIPQPGRYIFRIAPDHKTLVPVILDLEKPNGIIGTKDGRTLYVSNTHPLPMMIYKYDIKSDGSVSNATEFAAHGSDGMTLNEKGNLYLTGEEGVVILNPSGEEIKMIKTPQQPANVAFGGKDGKTLYITARTGLYSLQMTVKDGSR